MNVMDRTRQAVVVVHGMGQQKPGRTLARIVEAAIPERQDFPPDKAEGEPGYRPYKRTAIPDYYSHPDRLSGYVEQRKFIVPQHPHHLSPAKNKRHPERERWKDYWDSREGDDVRPMVVRPQTDFFEYHWAHLFSGNRFADLVGLIRRVVLRRPSRDTWPLQAAVASLLLIPLIVLPVVLLLVEKLPPWGLTLLVSGVLLPVVAWVAQYFGDVARYLSMAPADLAARREIHNGLSDLLRDLHASSDYDRIVVVAHSLGSYIAYDALTFLWPEFASTQADNAASDRGSHGADQEKLEALEQAGYRVVLGSLDEAGFGEFLPRNRVKYRDLQSEYWSEQRKLGNNWLVTDLVTLGSPMAYANLLIAKNRDDLRLQQSRREMPTCPPWREGPPRVQWWNPIPCDLLPHSKPGYWFSWTTPRVGLRIPNQAAVFSATRWTNIKLRRDYFGGELRLNFGDGIDDVVLPGDSRGSRTPLLAHSRYFSSPSAQDALRRAMRLETPPHVRVT